LHVNAPSKSPTGWLLPQSTVGAELGLNELFFVPNILKPDESPSIVCEEVEHEIFEFSLNIVISCLPHAGPWHLLLDYFFYLHISRIWRRIGQNSSTIGRWISTRTLVQETLLPISREYIVVVLRHRFILSNCEMIDLGCLHLPLALRSPRIGSCSCASDKGALVFRR